MKILVINAGSSSLKYQLFDMENEEVIAKGNCDRIGIDGVFTYKAPAKGVAVEENVAFPNHTVAANKVLETLVDPAIGVISDISEISAAGHRIVHGGSFFMEATLVDSDDVIEKIEACKTLAPLHAMPNAAGIRACRAAMPNIPHVAVFDTAFHSTMPDVAKTYSLPRELCEKYSIKRYGAHGTSHKYVSLKTAEFLGKKPEDLKMVTLHLGNGSSITAIDGGKCVDTSMGLTPLAGPLMGTRCGSVDPAIVPLLLDNELVKDEATGEMRHMNGTELNAIMNKKSGVYAVSGGYSDFRDLEARADAGDEKSALALDMFAYQCKQIMAGYIAVLGGVDCIVFTAGIGENGPRTRSKICKNLLAPLGIELDEEANDCKGVARDVTGKNSKVKVLVIPTNEELMIAKETLAVAFN
ncbi:MAG: acetate kinase [Clostridia bacterium]|nr:acetate kinase [Clostridia bacterium]